MSKYGEVKDLVDKIKIFSNLRIESHDVVLLCGYSAQSDEYRDESDEILKQIEKDLDRLVEMACRSDGVGTGYRMLDQYRRILDTVDEGLQKELLELLESILPVWIHEGKHMWNATDRQVKPRRVEHKGMVTFPIRPSNPVRDGAGVGDDVFVEGATNE